MRMDSRDDEGKPPRRGRPGLEPSDWIDAAIEALAEGGLPAVAIEPLARRLGVTKGSFYHHFGSLDALVEAVLEAWEEGGTDRVIRDLDAQADPRERLRALVHVSWDRLDHLRAEGALSAAAASGDARVAPVVARVTAKRLAYVERIYRALGHPRAAARRRALHALAAYLGTVTLVGAGAIGGERELRAYARHLEAALL
ncbi:MAG: TetR/AcrR family transcriptional regulator [Sandaracinaceae bacterium]|nr:TetR/AcrR family transcriptional regulator [Sandaracinaceae bacterium]